MKKKIIMLGIILISTASLLLVMFYIKTKDIKYISSNEIESYSNISMKLDGEEITTTSNLNSGYYRIDAQNTTCTGGNVSWSNISHKLKVKVTNAPLKCTIALVTVREDINVVAITIDNVESSTVPTSGWYNMTYECVDEYNNAITGEALPKITWDNYTYKLNTSNISSKVFCTVNFTAENYLDFEYTGTIQKVRLEHAGYYAVQVWGAQGGGVGGGYGAFAQGMYYTPNAGEVLSVVVGGQGKESILYGPYIDMESGGYNGGGCASGRRADPETAAGGGGATHVSKDALELKDLQSSGRTESIIIVAGGGGGGFNLPLKGGNGGGIEGGRGNFASNMPEYYSTGGTQDAGGKGYSVIYEIPEASGIQGRGGQFISILPTADGGELHLLINGGGGGWFGGGASTRIHAGGGGGSSFVGSSLLFSYGSIVKGVWCVDCTTSTDPNTLTSQAHGATPDPYTGWAKIGNGHASISYIGA